MKTIMNIMTICNMEEKKSSWGGRRENSGRPKGNKPCKILVSLSEESYYKLAGVKNRSEIIDNLIKQNL